MRRYRTLVNSRNYLIINSRHLCRTLPAQEYCVWLFKKYFTYGAVACTYTWTILTNIKRFSFFSVELVAIKLINNNNY